MVPNAVADNPLLTQDELDFIRDVLLSPRMGVSLAVPRSDIDAPRALELLRRLGESGKLTLEAKLEEQRLTFPLQVVGSEADHLHLEISAPRILESGKRTRAWRLMLDQPLPLLTIDGAPTSLDVWELSPDSARVRLREKNGTLPERFDFQLPLSDEHALPVSGELIRRIDPRTAAYQLKMSQAETERLRHFLFEHIEM